LNLGRTNIKILSISKTELIKVNSKRPEKSKIRKAAIIIRNGGLVAFPTETVYGLGANALDPKAVKKIFSAKGRPADNPLIIHISDIEDIFRLALNVPLIAKKIIQKYWPGPLTIILKKSKLVPYITTGGLETVAIRMPSHKIALSLIENSSTPIAAPSANLFGKPSPTLAEHVLEDLDGKIDLLIDGGKTDIGLESTVIDLTSKHPMLLRPGRISSKELCSFGQIHLHPTLKGKKTKNLIHKSPGMKYRHYSPNAKVILVKGPSKRCVQKISSLIKKYHKEQKRVGVITTNKKTRYKSDMTQFIGQDNDTIARNLFDSFRKFDKNGADVIIVKEIKDIELGFAIMNRLKKAAHQTIKT